MGKTTPARNVPVMIRMTKTEHAALVQRAKQEERTMAQVMRRAFRMYLNRKIEPSDG